MSLLRSVALLCHIILMDHVLDRWRWILDPINGYSIKGTYQYLSLPDTTLGCDLYDEALPTIDNHLRRRVLHHDNTICIGGCDCQETTLHLLFRCDIYGNLWHRIFQWLGISFISPDLVHDHLHQFGHMVAGLPRFKHSFLKVISHASVWIVWKEINNRIFKNKAQDLVHLLDNVKFISFSWLKANMLTSAFSYNDWWQELSKRAGPYGPARFARINIGLGPKILSPNFNRAF
ncbi:hypothetical protein MTR_6g044010 [Medicago truncatula]|uniref:Reverse transcriptase zinc-binding domain-containing protein n=1 Tax=Medicago truncatula TaxID=3880 RepID=A0A072UAG6_MEDTR|nr:hypothetical protein MTR_6g044010 [Medicago truncatula]